MRESRPYGSVRGALSNERSYRDSKHILQLMDQLLIRRFKRRFRLHDRCTKSVYLRIRLIGYA